MWPKGSRAQNSTKNRWGAEENETTLRNSRQFGPKLLHVQLILLSEPTGISRISVIHFHPIVVSFRTEPLQDCPAMT